MNYLSLKKYTGAASLALMVALGGSAKGADAHGSADKKLNIVFIELDDLTAKYVKPFGGDSAKTQTPTIDKLAEQGVVFENGMAQGTMCAPSRNSMFTGQYPRNLGFFINGSLKELPMGIWTLPKALKRQGYHTSWIGKSHLRVPLGGIPRNTPYKHNVGHIKNLGLDECTSSAGRVVVTKLVKDMGSKWVKGKDMYADYLYDKGLLEQFKADIGKVSTLKVDDYLDGNIAKRAENWIAKYDGKKPFFLWVNFSGPHGPYDPPGDWVKRYKNSDVPPLISDQKGSVIPPVLRTQLWENGREAALRSRAEYMGMIDFVDSQVARVVKAINDKGIRNDTMIVFFSDQGVMEGDHGLNHKYTLYKEVLNASLIIDLPGAQKGTRVKRPVELLDVVQTALELSGASKEERANAHGYSLLPLLKGEGDIPRKAAYSEIFGCVSMVTDDYKYIETPEGNVLFDLKKDPDETQNVITQLPEIAQKMAAQMEAWKKNDAGVEKKLTKADLKKIDEKVYKKLRKSKARKERQKNKQRNKNR